MIKNQTQGLNKPKNYIVSTANNCNEAQTRRFQHYIKSCESNIEEPLIYMRVSDLKLDVMKKHHHVLEIQQQAFLTKKKQQLMMH